MKLLLLIAWLACFLSSLSQAALVGFGIWPYNPPCAFACDRSLSSLIVSCSEPISMEGMMHMGASITSPQCRAGNTVWLTTLAWCIKDQCAKYNIPTYQLEEYWWKHVTDSPSVKPKWDYSSTLFNIPQLPNRTLTKDDTYLNTTAALVDPGTYLSQYNALTAVQRENVVESSFGIAIIVTGFGVPLVLTWLGYLPFMSGLLEKVKPYLVYPSTIGTYSVRPIPYKIGNAPTIGQTLYIVGFIILNVILTAVDYKSKQPHAWYATKSKEITGYVFYRTGTLAFVVAPLVFLFSSRNNVLLWMTNWSHSTYLLLHRWIARIFALQALLHTLLALPLYYKTESHKTYWVWGAVATIAAMILVFASGLYVRSYAYEVFLISHILLSVFLIAGCWYHIKDWIGLTWGYETWLYAAIAVWFVDRLLRVGRILKTGVRRAKVTELGAGYVRVDITGIRWASEPGKHVYAYFPTVNSTRPWENHPFSILPTALLQSSDRSSNSETNRSNSSGGEQSDEEKHNGFRTRVMTPSENCRRPGVGLTLFIKKSTGMTKYLQATDNLLTLLDGPYPNNSTKEILRCDRVLLIGGGIGITGLLPWMANHWNVKLCWSVKENARCLVDAMDGALSGLAEKDVRVGTRLNVQEFLAEEMAAGWRKVGVVVSGPGGLCDDARAAVVTAGKGGNTVFELEVDAYSW